MEKFDIEKYEYKAPSYRLRKNRPLFWIDEKKYARESRYDIADGIWKSRQGAKDEISILLSGDLLCQENLIEGYRKKEGGYDFKMCFDYIRPLLCAADFTAGNLETPISHTAPYRGEILTHEGPFYCNAPIEYLDALKYAGFDMLTTANNHTIDAGVRGLYETIENTRKFHFIQTGTFIEEGDKFVLVDICGFKIGFTAFSLTYNSMQANMKKSGKNILLNTYRRQAAEQIYKKMKEQGAEYTICFPHWGKEYTDKLSKKQMNMADELTEIGYDLIAGSHSHVVQKFEYRNGTPVIYSMGNLLTHMNLRKSSMDTQYPVICRLNLKRMDGRVTSEIAFIPCRIFKDIQEIPFTVVPMNDQLPLNDEIQRRMKPVEGKVKELLQNQEAIFDLDYPLKKEALKLLKQQEERKDKRIQELCSKESKEQKASSQKSFFMQKWNEIKYRNCISTYRGMFRKYKDAMKLVSLRAETEVVKIDGMVGDIPLTHIYNDQHSNDITRIIYISGQITYLGPKAFKNFHTLESVRLFKGLERIGRRTFENCERMTGVILPKSLTYIGSYAFCNCKRLQSIKIPKSVEKIGRCAFHGCEELTIYCEKDSYADSYARKYHIAVRHMPI